MTLPTETSIPAMEVEKLTLAWKFSHNWEMRKKFREDINSAKVPGLSDVVFKKKIRNARAWEELNWKSGSPLPAKNRNHSSCRSPNVRSKNRSRAKQYLKLVPMDLAK